MTCPDFADVAEGKALSFGGDPDLSTCDAASEFRAVAAARIPQLLGPEIVVADDAPVLDQLVGFLGRRPTWAPPTDDPV